MRASLADPSWHELNDANNSNKTMKNYTKFMFSKMATKIDEIFTVDLMVKIFSISVAFFENINFNQSRYIMR